ncbi:MAG TPA: hypothetical protein VFN05_04885 [Actinomycetes bacterium]|nr:hypothetical protein [Actinomycetes bacterium]
MVIPRARSRDLLAWSLWLATFGCCTAGLLVTLVVTQPLTLALLVEGAVYALAFPLGYATVGLVLALRRPANPIGWLYAASGVCRSLLIPLDPWVDQLIRSHRPLPLAAQLAAVAGEFNWAPAITLGITLPFLLLPNGRLRSRRWRVVAAAAVTGAVLITLAGGLMPGRTAETPLPIANPFGLAGTAGTIATVLTYIGVVLNTICYPAALLCAVLRFRASRGVERQQLRWVVAGAAGAVAGLLLGAWSSGVTYLAVVAVPASVAVAVLRYRLWDLDRLVSRTVTYVLVTALLVLPYLLILPATTRLAAGSGSLAVAALTLAAVAVFAPVRRRIQELVDRRFNRRPHPRGLRGEAARPGGPGRQRRGTSGRGGAHDAADPGIAVATPTSGPTHATVASAQPRQATIIACHPNTQAPCNSIRATTAARLTLGNHLVEAAG